MKKQQKEIDYRLIVQKLRRRAANVETTTTGWTGKKLEAYELVFSTAQVSGNFDAMREVAPFCGRKIVEEDIRACLSVAISNLDLKSVVGCMRALGDMTLNPAELEALSDECQRPDTVEFLLGIIGRHVPSRKLTPKEILSILSIR